MEVETAPAVRDKKRFEVKKVNCCGLIGRKHLNHMYIVFDMVSETIVVF